MLPCLLITSFYFDYFLFITPQSFIFIIFSFLFMPISSRHA